MDGRRKTLKKKNWTKIERIHNLYKSAPNNCETTEAREAVINQSTTAPNPASMCSKSPTEVSLQV